MGKGTKKLGDRSRSKKRRSLIGGCQEGTWQNSSTNREIESMKEKGKEDGTRIGADGNIPQDKES